MFQKVRNFLRKAGLFFAFGMKAADEQILHSGASSDANDGGIHQEQNEHRVAHHLLKGEVTQEVQELVYRTVLVDRESKSYEVYSPMKALKIPKKIETSVQRIYNEDNRPVLTIQENRAIGDNVLEAISRINAVEMKTDENGEVNCEIGRMPKPNRYTIYIGRSGLFMPRYKIEEYTKKVVCLIGSEEENRYIVDFYVTKYPNDKEWKSKGFVREIEHIKNDGVKSDVTDIRTIEFITHKAYGFFDGIFFKFGSLKLKGVYEYDGDYVVRFSAEIIENGKDFFNNLYSESMDRKYRTKAPKELVVNIDPYAETERREYKCSICGKTVSYDVMNIDGKTENEGVDDNTPDVTEYADMETTEQTFGRMICKDCLLKHKAEIMDEYQKQNEQ